MRSGQFAEAKIELEKALPAADSKITSTSYVRYFLALTEHYLGNAEAARMQLRTADNLADEELARAPSWKRKSTIELLRSKARTAIGEVGN